MSREEEEEGGRDCVCPLLVSRTSRLFWRVKRVTAQHYSALLPHSCAPGN